VDYIFRKDNIKKVQLNKVNPWYIFKAGIGSAIAIILAELFGLSYSPSAGIITLLTIQNTKKETLSIAAKRIISFLLAVTVSYLLFNGFGYNPWVFGIFVLIFAGLSNLFNLKEGISMNSVLMTHFLIEKRMDPQLFFNEVMILGIGMGIGVAVNMFMPSYRKEIFIKQYLLEIEFKKVLRAMAFALKNKKACLIQDFSDDLPNKEKPVFTGIETESGISDQGSLNNENIIINFRDLETLLEELLHKAYEDAGNRLLSDTRYLITYLEMRKHQIEVLKDISRDISNIPVLLKQSIPLADFLNRIADSFHEMNNAKGLLEDLKNLYNHYKQDKLPTTREEFEYRAVLYQILKELEYFLLIKRNFVIDIEKKNMKTYWNNNTDK